MLLALICLGIPHAQIAPSGAILFLDFEEGEPELKLFQGNYAGVGQVYSALGAGDRVHYRWYAGHHDYPAEARRAAMDWFRYRFSKSPRTF